MKKIQSLFCRNYDTDGLVRDEVVLGSEWVINGEGVATRKWDGTSCLVRDGHLFRRFDRKLTKKAPIRVGSKHPTRTGQERPYTIDDFKPAPPDWEPCEEGPNMITGHWPGWIPVLNTNDSRWHFAAWVANLAPLPDGTYELCGPHVNANYDGFDSDRFIPHGNVKYLDFPRTFDAIKATLAEMIIEGVVWHHPDGRMVKIKTRDFGLAWPSVVQP